MSTPSIPKGTRDFTPLEMARRNYIFDTIRNVFTLSGYQPIETPAMENLDTLLGKYGDEGDKLLFKVLNSGDFLAGSNDKALSDKDSGKLLKQISEKGLRYDLTVPFARFVVQHRNEIIFPFKRYQIQPVWRADRPQKGRYREFYQCDVDVVGSNSLIYEAEMARIADEIFLRLGIGVVIEMNNRKILAGIAEIIGEADKITDITVAIDKLDKIGIDGVNAELREKGLSDEKINKLQPILNLQGSNGEKLDQLESVLATSDTGIAGIAEMRAVFRYVETLRLISEIRLNLTLARGLNYYTGAIIEIKARDVQIGSISGGGRYDDLTGIFGMPGVSGVGISFGADRIYDVMNALSLFPESTAHSTKVMVANFGADEEMASLAFLHRLQKARIASEMYPEPAKMKKQFAYANQKQIPYIVIIGSDELASGLYQLKNMETGEQQKYPPAEIIAKLLGLNV
ncbi:MAG TPA: histidine--tRNA ligase [Bacteroidales bacterium]|nr:histidine--tRNA ligase [Bacteroidales bacterium]HPT03141.1 histidine--tRNA ligase [Bacteroidales bacterium]